MNLQKLTSRNFQPVFQNYTIKDVILYALGIGAGADPLDLGDLKYVYEKNLKPIPTIASVLCHPGFWLQDPEIQIDWLKILHGDQFVEIHRPFRQEDSVRADYRVLGVEDKGPDKGATLLFAKSLSSTLDNQPICTVRSTYFLRADGGCGHYGQRAETPSALPNRKPDEVLDLPTLPRQALIYRLSGDMNPLHADPQAASEAGFKRPILQGLCTMGFACRALIDTYCGGETEQLKSIYVRFTNPVFPGETIRVEFFEEDKSIRFRARVLERDLIVLDRGDARLLSKSCNID